MRRDFIAVTAATFMVAAGAAILVLTLHGGSSPQAQVLPGAGFRIPATGLPPVPTAPAEPVDQNASAAGGDRVPQPCVVPPQPWQVAIPRLCLRAQVVPTGAGADGLTIPGDVHQVALWTGGADLPSGPERHGVGTTLLAGHVDDLTQGDGAFHDLYLVQPGEAVFTTDASGHTRRWRVVALTVARRTAVPSFVWQGKVGPRRLVLVTCGGRIVQVPGYGGHYVDNVIVTAVPG